MCPCEFSVPTNAHVRIDYACEVLYVILILNYIKGSNTKNIIFLSLMLSDCSFTMLLCELP